MQEHRTAGIAAAWLRRFGYEVTEGIGGTGVVGVLRNGAGATVLLRADMDALPVTEATGLDYASRATGTDRFGTASGIAHACGHDMHMVWLMGVARLLAETRPAWSGTVMALFQPGEETGQGARAMVEAGLVKDFPRPDVVLGQHVVPAPAGMVGWRAGTIMAASDSWEVTLFGRGAHGSMPQKSVDPVLMAAASVLRLQGVVAREVAMADAAVVTVGALQAGSAENVIPDRALLRLNVRSFKAEVRERVLSAIRRILTAEAQASGAPRPPDIAVLGEHPTTCNDAAATAKVVEAFERQFGKERIQEIEPASASEDFSLLGAAWARPRCSGLSAARTLSASPPRWQPASWTSCPAITRRISRPSSIRPWVPASRRCSRRPACGSPPRLPCAERHERHDPARSAEYGRHAGLRA